MRFFIILPLFLSCLVVGYAKNIDWRDASSEKDDLMMSASAYAKVTKRDDEPKFSIGLGTLSPSYSQKLGPDGRTKLDFNQEKNGFSYSVSNVNHHQLQTGSSENSPTKEVDPNLKNHNYGLLSHYQAGQPNINIYHQQGLAPHPMSAYSNSIYGQSASQFNPTQGMMPFSSGQFYSAPMTPAYSNPASVYQSHGSSVNTPQKSESKVDTASSTNPSNGNSHALSGGIFNYGLSQHHSPLPFVSPMNFNPFSGPSVGHSASTPSPTTQPNPANSMSYSGYGSDPYGYMGGPGSGGYGGFGNMAAGASPLQSVAGMPGGTPYSMSTNSPYSMMSSLMSMFPGMSSMGF
ncbi:uncharacterized protein LOC141855417 [Brevipalpus obovatus]|uniref:uncharacterized protein LOC141855417 n=1 Tax=Brevipalpus obovatus TaxID=246614 RepID=UPI003D9EC29C